MPSIIQVSINSHIIVNLIYNYIISPK